jgi:hypothetical protein
VIEEVVEQNLSVIENYARNMAEFLAEIGKQQ